uniref:SH3 domain-containing protein C23A1.17 n=1 Tax=Talaromyces marneffei PM1 TaxID=1077442 RepID=A0A093Y2X9_TALMA
MASYILASLRRAGSGLFVTSSPSSSVVDSSLAPEEDTIARPSSPQKDTVAECPSPQEKTIVARLHPPEKETMARSPSPQKEHEALFVSQEEAKTRSPFLEEATASPSPAPITTGLTQAEFEDSQRASTLRLPWDWRVSGKTTEEYTPQIQGKWWSKTAEELRSAQPNKRRDYGHIGRIMETELGEQLHGKQKCTACQTNNEECWIYSTRGSRQVSRPGDACARCRRTARKGGCNLAKRRSNKRRRSSPDPAPRVYRPGGTVERCFRLKKDCKPSSSVRKKRATPRQSSQTARLEQKLDGLVSLLKANSQGGLSTEALEASASNISANTLTSTNIGPAENATPNPSPQSPSKYRNGCEPPGSCLLSPPSQASYQENTRPQNRSAPITPASNPSASFTYSLPRDVEPNAEEAELWFLTFQTKYLEHIPFAIPYIQNTSSTQLRQDKPALWLGIMAISCPYVPKQLNLGRAFKDMIAREVVVNGERTTDLLLSILTFGHCCAFFHQKTESVPWSTYHDEVLKTLDDARETRADAFQVAQVKFMHILSNVTKLYARLRAGENEATTQFIVPYIRSLKCQLNELKNQMPDYVAESKYIQLTNFYVEIAVYEIALVRVQYVPLAADCELESMQCLLACTQALRSWRDLFLTLGPKDYIGIPITLWKQLGLVIHTVMRLATLEDPAWDVEHLKKTVNLPAMFDVICSHLEYVEALEPWKSNVGDDIHKRSRKHMIGLMNWTNAVFAGLPAQLPSVENPWSGAKPDGQETQQQERRKRSVQQPQPQQQQQQQMPTAQQPDTSHMLMMNGQNQSSEAAETAAVLAQQMQPPLPPEMFPYFNQEPWAEDVFGFWDLYTGGRIYG